MAKIWKLKPQISLDIGKSLSGYPKLLAQLLYSRGLTEKDKIEEFLGSKYEGLHSPFLFLDMQKAVQRIWLAIERGEKICVYGDYDADAVTANAVLRQTFKYLSAVAESYIPDRFTEGYGINLEALSKIKNDGSTLIITVDCGTNSVDAAEWCGRNEIDLIITDHHEIIGEKPKAFALINPKNIDDNYPYREITGVGVAFKLACAILTSAKCKEQSAKYIQGYEKLLLDLVAIGTVADCHSLLGENRTLVKYGLKVLAKTKWVGLKALLESCGIDLKQRPLDSYVLGFIIAPRLNAAGRLEHANIALDLLLTEDFEAAREQATALEKINKRRQDLTLRVVSEAKEQALLASERKILVLWAKDWPKGIVGLVAGKLAEEFNKPVIVLEKGESESTGSARTAGKFNIIDALKNASEYLLKFGGHSQAAGLNLKNEDFEQFYQKLLEFAEAQLPAENLGKILEADAELAESDLGLDIYQMVSALEPFGVDNKKPVFILKNASVNNFKFVGKGEKHMQLEVSIGNKNIKAIWFNAGNFAKNLKLSDTVNIAAELFLDSWNGRENLKLRIVDVEL